MADFDVTTLFVNLTPHDVNVKTTDGTVVTIPKSGQVARVDVTRTDVCTFGNIKLHKTKFGDVVGLPDRQSDKWFIVSALVKNAANRDDLVSPGSLIRDDAGNVIGCDGLDV